MTAKTAFVAGADPSVAAAARQIWDVPRGGPLDLLVSEMFRRA